MQPVKLTLKCLGENMAAAEGPTVQRRRLMLELRSMREAAGLKQDQVTEAMDWSPSKILRIEGGRSGVSTNDMRALLVLYGVEGEDRRAELVELAQMSRKRGWWGKYRTVLSTAYTDYIAFEAEASSIRGFQPLVVPGLLQTEEYAKAVFRESALRELSEEEIDARLAARMARQESLTQRESLRLGLVLGEPVLRQMVGGPEVMRRQLQHLVRLSQRPKLAIQVLPFGAGAHPGLSGSFMILEFPGSVGADFVYLDNALGGVCLEDTAEVRQHGLTFEYLARMALSPDDSVALITRAAEAIP